MPAISGLSSLRRSREGHQLLTEIKGTRSRIDDRSFPDYMRPADPPKFVGQRDTVTRDSLRKLGFSK